MKLFDGMTPEELYHYFEVNPSAAWLLYDNPEETKFWAENTAGELIEELVGKRPTLEAIKTRFKAKSIWDFEYPETILESIT